MEDLRRRSLWHSTSIRPKRPRCLKSHPQNHPPKAHLELLKWKTPLIKNMRMSLMKMSSLSSHKRSVKCGRIKAYPNGINLPKRCSRKGRTKTKAP